MMLFGSPPSVWALHMLLLRECIDRRSGSISLFFVGSAIAVSAALYGFALGKLLFIGMYKIFGVRRKKPCQQHTLFGNDDRAFLEIMMCTVSMVLSVLAAFIIFSSAK